MSSKKINIEELYDKTGSLYKLVILASRRAVELNDGAVQLTEYEKDNVSETALKEIIEGRVSYKGQKQDK